MTELRALSTYAIEIWRTDETFKKTNNENYFQLYSLLTCRNTRNRILFSSGGCFFTSDTYNGKSIYLLINTF